MTPRDFVYWLQGYLEVSESKELTAKQLAVVKKHIALVLTNVTDEVDETAVPQTGAPKGPLAPSKDISEEIVKAVQKSLSDQWKHLRPNVTCSTRPFDIGGVKLC